MVYEAGLFNTLKCLGNHNSWLTHNNKPETGGRQTESWFIPSLGHSGSRGENYWVQLMLGLSRLRHVRLIPGLALCANQNTVLFSRPQFYLLVIFSTEHVSIFICSCFIYQIAFFFNCCKPPQVMQTHWKGPVYKKIVTGEQVKKQCSSGYQMLRMRRGWPSYLCLWVSQRHWEQNAAPDGSLVSAPETFLSSYIPWHNFVSVAEIPPPTALNVERKHTSHS